MNKKIFISIALIICLAITSIAPFASALETNTVNSVTPDVYMNTVRQASMYLDQYGQTLAFNGNEIERLINAGLIYTAAIEIFSEHIGVVNELITNNCVYPIDRISSEGVRWVLDASPLRDMVYDLLKRYTYTSSSGVWFNVSMGGEANEQILFQDSISGNTSAITYKVYGFDYYLDNYICSSLGGEIRYEAALAGMSIVPHTVSSMTLALYDSRTLIQYMNHGNGVKISFAGWIPSASYRCETL